jgi:PTH2 family peptidyl-tRNA hydrolase
MSIPKQVIVVRKDLNMRKGKIAAQAAHASMGAILNYGQYADENPNQYNLVIYNDAVHEWLDGLYTKVCVSVDSEAELLEIRDKAVAADLNVKLVTDAGLTEFNGVPTLTCLAIGPDYPERIDLITKHLKLL